MYEGAGSACMYGRVGSWRQRSTRYKDCWRLQSLVGDKTSGVCSGVHPIVGSKRHGGVVGVIVGVAKGKKE